MLTNTLLWYAWGDRGRCLYTSAATKAADEESEVLLDKLTRGEMSVESFLSTYTPLRKVYHVREQKRADMAPKLASYDRNYDDRYH